VKLMDFGIVMDIDNQGLTRPGLMVGSPSYLSPEQVLGDAITPAADLFLLGICLYEMLTGSRPFHDEGNETVFQRIRETRYTPARQMQSRIPPELEKIVTRCLRKDPEKRFKGVKPLIRALEKYLGPERSSHAEDVILKYLDEEALLNPSVSYTAVEPSETGTHALLKSRSVLAAGLALMFIGFGCGYLLGHSRGAQSPALTAIDAKPFPAPTTLRKPPKR
jgi:serine/threonine-protein kinase